MDIKKYIASGVLEAYVLGQLTLAEQQEVHAMLNSYPELKKELDEVERSFEELAQESAIKPTLSLEDIIAGGSLDQEPIIPLDNESTKPTTEGAKVVELNKDYYVKSLKRYKTTSIAATIAALIASAAAFNFYNRAINSENTLAAIQAEQQEFADNYNVVRESLNDLESDLAIMEDPRNQRIALAGTDNAPDAMVLAYWNEDSEDLFVKIKNLKELADNQQYQLWAIVDGKPVDAGVFDWNAGGLLKMNSFGKGVELFAVTIEPRGGSEGPSLETMQVAGAPSLSQS